MNLIKAFSLLAFLAIMSCQATSQIDDSKHYTLHINLENAPFDSLYLHDYTNGRDLLFTGKKTQKFTWEISIPDSIISNYENMELLVSEYDSISNSVRIARFIADREGKQIIIANVGLEDRNTYIKGSYIGQTYIPEGASLNVEGSEIDADIFIEDFKLIIEDEQSDIAVRAQDPFFSWFSDFEGEGITYDDFLASYTEIAKKHPDSRFLLTSLATNLTNYKSKEDVRTIYNILSNKHRNTLWAKMIDRYLLGRFENTSLPTLNNNTEENIVQDSSKYNLIIFSASWCVACIEEIPLLKEIHTDLNKDLILTFVSMDDDKTVAYFHKLIEEKDIPWRTLFAYQDVRKIQRKYVAETIPHNILVHPNGDMEIIDVRKDENRAKLYSLF